MICIDKIKNKYVPKNHTIEGMYNPLYYPLLVILLRFGKYFTVDQLQNQN